MITILSNGQIITMFMSKELVFYIYISNLVLTHKFLLKRLFIHFMRKLKVDSGVIGSLNKNICLTQSDTGIFYYISLHSDNRHIILWLNAFKLNKAYLHLIKRGIHYKLLHFNWPMDDSICEMNQNSEIQNRGSQVQFHDIVIGTKSKITGDGHNSKMVRLDMIPRQWNWS